MEVFLLEALLIFILIVLNGFFSGSEIAIISARRGAIEELAKQGNRSAKLVSKMKKEPDRFLATVQVGVTIVGTLASVIGGVVAIEFLKPILATIPVSFVQGHAELMAVGLVVIVISYGLLVIGELVPKSVSLRHAERIACTTARPLDVISRATWLVVKLLTASTQGVMRLLRIKGAEEERVFVSEEELKFYITEGREKGVFEETEASLLHGIFEFADTTVREVMVAKPNVSAIDVTTPPEEVLSKVVEPGFSRYPVFEGSMERVVGILFNKDVYKALSEERPLELRSIMRAPYFVPDSIMISRLLREMQRRKSHIAIVVDEHGNVDGLITIEDILEEIVGEIEDEYDIEKEGLIERQRDGTMLIDASASLRDLEAHGLPFEESEEYNTLAGLLLSKLQRLPRGGEFIVHKGIRLTVVDIEDKRIVKVKAEIVKKPKVVDIKTA